MEPQRHLIPGSAPRHSTGGSWTDVSSGRQLRATIIIRRPAKAEALGRELLSGLPPPAREETVQMLRAEAADLDAVREFGRSNNLKVVAENADARTLELQGSPSELGKAFGVEIRQRTDDQGHSYVSYQGPLTLPASLANVVEAVFGLDQRPLAKRSAGQ
jgi:kumamolisin